MPTLLPPPPPGGRTSLKQAKANFKARHYNPLSEREKKQLERAVELERRAWRAQESAKRKAEAIKKRDAKASKEREDAERAMLGSQRRCDRFGYKSSQMHLGAFFGNRALARKRVDDNTDAENQGEDEVQKDLEMQRDENGDTVQISHATLAPKEDSFGDGDIDDETLLDALDEGDSMQTGPAEPPPQCIPMKHIRPPLTTAVSRVPLGPPAPVVPSDDMSSFWDQLDSSTQIARELHEESGRPHGITQQSSAKSTTEGKARSQEKLKATLSFGSDDFDISVEEIEESMSQTKLPILKASSDRKLMPPPMLPTNPKLPAQKQSRMQAPSCNRASAPISKLAMNAAAPRSPVPPKPQIIPASLLARQTKSMPGPPRKMAAPVPPQSSRQGGTAYAGLTLSELESFVDDDLQLTQAT